MPPAIDKPTSNGQKKTWRTLRLLRSGSKEPTCGCANKAARAAELLMLPDTSICSSGRDRVGLIDPRTRRVRIIARSALRVLTRLLHVCRPERQRVLRLPARPCRDRALNARLKQQILAFDRIDHGPGTGQSNQPRQAPSLHSRGSVRYGDRLVASVADPGTFR